MAALHDLLGRGPGAAGGGGALPGGRAAERDSAAAATGPTQQGGALPRVMEQCPLCSVEFDASGQGCRPSCPMASGCRVVCCPSCGYSFPQENAGLAGKLKQFFQRRQTGRGP